MLHTLGLPQAAAQTMAAFFCLYLLNSPRWVLAKFLGAVTFAVIASYTSGQGLLVWPVGLLPLAVAPFSKRRKIALVAAWCVIATVVSLLYFWGWTRVEVHPPPQFSLAYFATIVGGALFPDLSAAITGGAILLFLSAASIVLTVRLGKAQEYSFWLAIVIYGILVNAQTTVGRTGFGTAQGLSSRYATFSLSTVVGVYAILSSLNFEKLTRVVPSLWGATLALVVLGVTLSSVNGYQIGAYMKQDREYHVFLFLTADTQPDEALPTAPWEKGAEDRVRLQYMKEHRLNAFHSPDPAPNWALPAPGLTVLSYPARIQVSPLQVNTEHGQQGLLTLNGIALDGKENKPVGGVFVEVDNVIYPTYYGLAREEVAQALKTSERQPMRFSP